MKQLFIIILTLSCCYCSNAQDLKYAKTNEVELWKAGRVQYKLGKRLTFNAELQNRLNNNLTSYDRTFVELETKFRFAKRWQFGVGYRYIGLNDNEGNQQGFETYQRWQFDLEHKRKIRRFELENRWRYQSRKQFNIENATTFEIPPTTDFRWKIALSYNIRKWKFDPKIGYEAFLHTEYGDLDGFTKYRWFIGTDYKLNKSHKISFDFVQENETLIWNAENSSILRVKYTYQLKNDRKN